MDARKLSDSQNFLNNPDFVRTLIYKSNICNNDLVVEIGPGKGVITGELSKKAGKVVGIEYDSNLASNLKLKFSSYPNVEIVQGDFLSWDLPTKPYKVFANIPFNLTSDIVNKLLNSQNPPEVTYLIMQDEAAERFIGEPLGLNSQTSILLQPFYNMDVLAKIDRSNFMPMPKVNAVLAKFEKRKSPLINLKDRQLFRDFIIYGFNQWKPTVEDAFKKVFSQKQLKKIEKDLKIGKLKPSQLNINQWILLFNTFVHYVSDEKKSFVEGAEKELRLKQVGMQKQHRTREK